MAQGAMNLHQQFVNFAKFGETKADGRTITLTQLDKWFKQANIFNLMKMSLTDTGVCFNKFKKKNITFENFKKFLVDLAERKDVEVQEIEKLLIECGLPGTTKTTQGVKVVSKEEDRPIEGPPEGM